MEGSHKSFSILDALCPVFNSQQLKILYDFIFPSVLFGLPAVRVPNG
jgi:hypothetical protein